ncbi:T6SS immunity protein Tli4 family protein [Serratia sp. DD3]|uniref:T6SS immunity protein Tli4 family protein n=1 Tax=Serratia sp. DD3 TaxID=1410619 RepID=UPI0004D7DD2F|nr:T6SS immunity protein Tli4 family protein [Serratia sp. DD3]KEY58901.1 hypothetical protein SRDD_21790 [Serratia sp. DD3]
MLIEHKISNLRSLLVIVMMGVIFFNQQAQASTYQKKGNPVIDELFKSIKPQCIGRYIIDVPESFNNQLRDMVFIDDFKIESKPIYAPAFRQRIMLREQELRDEINKPGNYSENAPFLKEVFRLSNDKGVIFDSNKSGSDDSFRKLEAHIYVDSIAFIITTNILDLSASKYIEEKKTYLNSGFTEAETNTKPAKLAALQSLISRLSGRKDEEIPKNKGVCIPNGFIKDDGVKHSEKLTFRYENSDFIFGSEMDNTMLGSKDTLFGRSAQINEAMVGSNKYTIKKGELSPGGIPSQEWLFGGKQEFKHQGAREIIPIYDFTFYANEAVASPTKPWLNIELSSAYKKTRYSDAQMIEIWDRLVGSLRYQPNTY